MTDQGLPIALIVPLVAIGLFLMIYPPYMRMRRRARRREEGRAGRRSRRRGR